MVDSGVGEITYHVYDGAGERVRKVTDATADSVTVAKRRTERVYLGDFEIYREFGTAGVVKLARTTVHINDGAGRVAMVDTRTDGGSNERLVRYQYSNHLGSAVVELDADAKLISYEEFYSYGSTALLIIRDGTPPKRYRYTGKERDEETGLNYHGARFYALWLCRWTTVDPLRAVDGNNLYSYVRCNPVRLSDPTGQKAIVDQIEDIDSPAGWFLARTAYDLWNVASLGTLNRVEAQDNLGTFEGLADSAGRGVRAISNTASLGFQDRIYESQMENGPGVESIVYGANQAIDDLLPIAEADTLAHPDATAGELWQAGGMAVAKTANLFLLGLAATGKNVTVPKLKGSGTHPQSATLAEVGQAWQRRALTGRLRKTGDAPKVKQRAIWEKAYGKLNKKYQVDHIVEKQLGGAPKDLANLAPLEASANMSSGARIMNQIRSHRLGQRYDRVLLEGERVPVPDALAFPLINSATREDQDH